MADQQPPPPPEDEPVQRREVVEKTEVVNTAPPRQSTPMAIWLIPLVLIVIALVWFVLSSGEPSSPVDSVRDIQIESPEINAPDVDVEVPAADGDGA